ncbi:hypothetical protein BH23ACT6_BH23ACT6_09730 [soil metagenome]
MTVLARRLLRCDPATAWSVLSDVAQWPSWVDSIDDVHVNVEPASDLVPDVDVAGEHTAYRIEQPPLPSTVWTIMQLEDVQWEGRQSTETQLTDTQWTDPRPMEADGQQRAFFEWRAEGVSNLVTERYAVLAQGTAASVSIDVTWSGRTAWFARATYGPVRQRYAQAHLEALDKQCAGMRDR